ncbi:hypothetical protein ABEF95_002601 [Exophiala dermatitidis]
MAMANSASFFTFYLNPRPPAESISESINTISSSYTNTTTTNATGGLSSPSPSSISLLPLLSPHHLTLTNLLNLLLLILILLNIKVFPFIYHLRILNAVRFVLKSQRPAHDMTPTHLFQPIITSSKACLMEIDVFGHKNNSTYFTDIDIARAHLVTTLFGKGIAKIRGGTTMNGLSSKRSNFTIALGGVSCTFRKELLPYETYDLWTRVLAWDEKWVYLVTHFVKRRNGHRVDPKMSSLYPRQNGTRNSNNITTTKEDECAAGREDRRDSASSTSTGSTGTGTAGSDTDPSIAASALSKIVFKNGRVTIRPQEMLEASGLVPPVVTPTQDPTEEAEANATTTATSTDEPEDETDVDDNVKLARAIEAQRQRGLRLAALLADQRALHDEFNSDVVALGRHYDGIGLEGVVATLAQLGKLSSYQLI